MARDTLYVDAEEVVVAHVESAACYSSNKVPLSLSLSLSLSDRPTRKPIWNVPKRAHGNRKSFASARLYFTTRRRLKTVLLFLLFFFLFLRARFNDQLPARHSSRRLISLRSRRFRGHRVHTGRLILTNLFLISALLPSPPYTSTPSPMILRASYNSLLSLVIVKPNHRR